MYVSKEVWAEIFDILKKYKIPYTTHFDSEDKHIQINLTIPDYYTES